MEKLMGEGKKTETPLGRFQRLLNSGDLSAAEQYALKISNDDSTRFSLLSLIDIASKKFDHAADKLRVAIQLNKENHLAKGYLGLCEVARKQWRTAEKLLDEALIAFPEDLNFLLNRAIVYSENQQFDESLNITSRLLKKNPGPNVYSLHIGALRAKYEFEPALKAMDEALEKFPEQIDLLKIKADLLSEIDPKQAVNTYDYIASKTNLGAATKWNASFSYLRLEKFQIGFEYYENGLSSDIGKIGRPLPIITKNLARVDAVNAIDPERWVVIAGEQGIGDQVYFASVLKELSQITEKIILVCDKRMIPIFRRSFPKISVHEFGLINLLKNNDQVQGLIPIGSLMKDFRRKKKDFEKGRATYLIADSAKVEKFRKKLKEFGANKPLIGISWTGGFWERQKKGKSIMLEHWEPIISRKDVTFVSLQYGDTKKEQDYCKTNGYNVKFIEGVNFQNDLDTWHALITSCDVILSISTAMVHFAAASGKKVYLLLNTTQQPFCWGLRSTKSFVYPDVNIVRMTEKESVTEYFGRISKLFEG